VQIADARNALPARLGLGQRRQQHAGEDANDGDNDQQLDERETGRLRSMGTPEHGRG
jgi:hypothetical protein